MRSKSAQITIFVILAALLVLSMIFVISNNNSPIALFSDQKSSSSVKLFVESCVELKTKEAVRKVGLSGGWLYSSPLLLTDREKPEAFNQRAEGLNFLEKIQMPYWYYYDDATETFQFNIPEYSSDNSYSIKNQLKRYVTENIEECLDDFSSFEGIYTVEYDRELTEVTVELDQGDDILVTLSMPLTVEEINANATEFINQITISIENKIWVPYNLAKDITTAEAESYFIEKRIIGFMNPYQSSESRDILPPFYDFRMTYDFRPWDLKQVESLVKSIVNSHISKIQFINTEEYTTPLDQRLQDNEFATGLQSLYTKDYLSEHSTASPELFDQFQDYSVTPIYEPFFPSYIDIAPGMGGQILLPRPQAVIDLIPFFFTEYVAVYEMTMPIIFEIKESTADESDFVFKLALESNIDYNKPLQENYKLDLDLEVLSLSQAPSLVCDPPHFISEYYYLNITDPIAQNGVEGAFVSFSCKNVATCYVGETTVNENSGKTELSMRLPINCDPGTLEIYKYGHRTVTFDNLNPTLTQSHNLGEVEMPSEKELTVNVNILTPTSGQYSEGRDIQSNEEAFIVLEHEEEENYVQVLAVDSLNQYDLTLSLLPGSYSVQGFIIYNSSVIIPEEEVCYKKGLFSGEECQTLPAINLDSWVRGGIELTGVEFDTRELFNAEKITLNLIDSGIPNSYETLQEQSKTLSQLELASSGKEPYLD